MIDAVPGRINSIWYVPDQAKEFLIQCREYCGFSHYQRAKLFVEEPAGGGEQEAQVTNASTNNLIPPLARSSRKLSFSFISYCAIFWSMNRMIISMPTSDVLKQNAFIDIVFNVWPNREGHDASWLEVRNHARCEILFSTHHTDTYVLSFLTLFFLGERLLFRSEQNFSPGAQLFGRC